jgi:hypothetical protein
MTQWPSAVFPPVPFSMVASDPVASAMPFSRVASDPVAPAAPFSHPVAPAVPFSHPVAPAVPFSMAPFTAAAPADSIAAQVPGRWLSNGPSSFPSVALQPREPAGLALQPPQPPHSDTVPATLHERVRNLERCVFGIRSFGPSPVPRVVAPWAPFAKSAAAGRNVPETPFLPVLPRLPVTPPGALGPGLQTPQEPPRDSWLAQRLAQPVASGWHSRWHSGWHNGWRSGCGWHSDDWHSGGWHSDDWHSSN